MVVTLLYLPSICRRVSHASRKRQQWFDCL